jgi:hypothetical protein
MASAWRSDAGHDLLGIHSRLDDLQRHFPANRVELFGEPDLTHAAFADVVKQAVAVEGDRSRLEALHLGVPGRERVLGRESELAHGSTQRD